MTGTERETVERAILEGDDDRPRTINLDDLAEGLEITPSALSRRLASAEGEITRALLEGHSYISPCLPD